LRTWGWRKLHTEEVHNFVLFKYYYMIKSRRMRWVGHEAYMWDVRNAYNILVVNPEGQRLLKTT
jgi:hypothetical protein